MELDFNSFNQEFNNYEEKYVFLLNKTLKHLSLSFEPYISVTLVDNDYIHEINRQYRHIDRPTDVISFAFLDGDKNREKILSNKGPVCLGDIYISLDKAKEQAEEFKHPLDRELSFLFVHGLLHLLGYDHMTKEDEEVMFKIQDEILPPKEK